MSTASQVDPTEQEESTPQNSKARLEALIASLPSAVLVEDEDRNIVLCNAALCNLFSIPVQPEAMIGHNCSGAAEQAKHLFCDQEAFVRGVSDALAKRLERTNDLFHLVDGRALERDYVPVWQGNHYLGHLWNYRDVTEREQLGRKLADHATQLVETNDRLRVAGEALADFAATAAHDLSAPVRRMSMFASVLKENPAVIADPNAVELVESIQGNARRANSLISALLDFATAGGETESIVCSAAEAYAVAVETLAPLIKESGGEVHCSALPNVLAHPVLLAQVFQNVIGNALTYCTDRTPVIEVRAVDREGAYEFMVADNGPGIAAEDRKRVFGALTRGPSAAGRAGHGLGLAICARLIKSWGQEIWFEANEPCGTRLHFTLDAADGRELPDGEAGF